MIPRLLAGALLGVVVSMLLFGFMLQLVRSDQVEVLLAEAVTELRIVDLPAEPPPDTAVETSTATEPQSAPPQASDLIPVLAAPLQAQAAPLPLPAVAVPSLRDFAPTIAAPHSGWSAPLSGDGLQEGEKGRGYIEVVPLATRRPNIPERAWQHKIDGWVRVAFRLTREGRTADVRVLDAHPGGVFEENVVRAVEDWLYDMRDLDHAGELILTQKIQLFWRDYPDNSPYLD
ncbi:energy transducer TonB [Ketobacter sp.]|uniref:energy transducer TonB n=1 Tax=Ketobacter sp. TaxID=2083498 RepID=UPI000F2D9CE3|nr:TonB family protein [Ketobacter sp.]RLU01066.1 MAG: TonB family protein [Ketobacter sp.]